MKRGLVKNRSGLLAALDVGSTKVCCFIAKPDGERPPKVIGIGQQVSRGMKNGMIVDIEEVEAAIVNAVHAAEQMAGTTISACPPGENASTASIGGASPSVTTIRENAAESKATNMQ